MRKKNRGNKAQTTSQASRNIIGNTSSTDCAHALVTKADLKDRASSSACARLQQLSEEMPGSHVDHLDLTLSDRTNGDQGTTTNQ